MPLSEAQKKVLAFLAKEAKLEPTVAKPLKPFSTGSIVLDALSGCGGLPRGRVIELSGAESSGKSTVATAICGVAQSLPQGFKPVYIDVEHTFDPGYAKKLKFDLGDPKDPKAFLFQPCSIEEATEIACSFAALPETGVIVFDSIAAARPQSELDGSEQIGQHSKAVAALCNRISRLIDASEVLFIGVNQNRVKMEKIGMRTIVSEDVAGGKSWKYTCTCRFNLKIVGCERGMELNPLTGKDEEIRITNRVRINTLKNKAGFPHRVGEIIIRFGEGIDNISTVIELAEAYKVLEKSGNGYYKYESKKKADHSFTERGSELLRKRLLSNKALLTEIVDGIGLDRILANTQPPVSAETRPIEEGTEEVEVQEPN